MIGLSISGISFLENLLTEEVFVIIENLIGTKLSFKTYEEWIKKKHEKDFPFSSEKKLTEFIRKNNIKIKNTGFDLEEILKRFDKEYKNKIIKENEKIFKNIFWEKIKKLNLENINSLIEKNENGNNEEDEKNYDKYINKLLKNIDENKRKIILANNFMRRDGRNWLTDESREGKDINEKIRNAFDELNDIADRVIRNEIEKSLDIEIDTKKKIRDEKDKEINKQKEIYSKKKKNYEDNLETYNKRLDKYNAKIKQTDIDIQNYNNKLAEYNKDNSKVDKEKLDNERKEIENVQEELKKEKEEIEKNKEEIDKERENVNKENDVTNTLIDEYNK